MYVSYAVGNNGSNYEGWVLTLLTQTLRWLASW